MLDRVKEFLKQEEKLRAGKINKIPIDFDLWKEKASLAELRTFECTKFYSAIFDKGDKKYSEYLQELDSTFGKIPCYSLEENESTRGAQATNSLEDDDPWIDEGVHIEVIKLFLNSGYEPPLKDQDGAYNLVALLQHLFVYEVYCKYVIPSSGYFHPVVNCCIDFAAMKLFNIATLMITGIQKKGFHIDRISKRLITTGDKQRTRQNYVDQELLSMHKENPTMPSVTLSGLAEKVIINIGKDLKEKKIGYEVQVIKENIRKSKHYSLFVIK